MAQSIVVYQGKSFTVELQSMYGSSPYGWCLSTLPKGIILLGTEIVEASSPYQMGPVNHKFYFAAASGDLIMTLEFVLAAAFCPEDIKDTYTVEVQVVPANPQQFVPYTENAVTNTKYGYMCAGPDPRAVPDYGFIYQQQEPPAFVKYGYPCAEQNNNTLIKYGFPCGEQNNAVSLKYGYPCGDQNNAVSLKYGYPCGEQNNAVSLKYGYPCGEQNNAVSLKYGYPCGDQPGLKYGYPCGYNAAVAEANKPYYRGGAAPANNCSASDVDAMKTIQPYGMVYINGGGRKYGFPNC